LKLKSLVITGFKSFANKTTINFTDGLTAIVGPNGSGKSNVVEAIRWVLGEQSSKNLRGTKMSDVIFSGSSTHKAVSRAEVQLILDNEDHYIDTPYSEVVITRRLFRNGDSQYLINNKECRLKDINQLFMDTGMGLGSFSIISQGNVEAIFNSKPEDRRSIIETAAGVYKYKQQKHDANLKLEQTHDNLARVEDIILELKSQNNSLQKQSEDAKNYLSLKADLKKYDISRIAIELNQLGTEWNNVKRDITMNQNQIKQLEDHLASLTEHKKEINHNIDTLLVTREKYQKTLLDKSKQLEQLSGKKNLSMQEIKFKKSSLKEHEFNLNKKKQQFIDLKQRQSDMAQKRSDVSTKIKKLRQQYKNLDSNSIEKLIAEKKATYENLRNEYLSIMQKIANVNNKDNYLDKVQKQTDFRNISQQNRVADINKEINDAEDYLKQLKSKYDDKNVKYSAFTTDVNHLQEDISQLQATLTTQKQDWYKQLEILQNLKIKYDSLNNLQKNYHTFYKGAQSILKNKKQLKGILGAVSDFINVSGQYLIAIETALGNQTQNIIVQDSAAAREAVHFLRDKHLGRATFLPINEVVSRKINPNVLRICQQQSGFVGIANELVQTADRFKTIINHLLGNVIIVKDLKTATILSQKIRHTNRIVSLNGDVVNAGGSIVGGSSGHQQGGMLSQKKQLTALEAQISPLKSKTVAMESTLSKVQNKLAAKQNQLNDLYSQQMKLKTDLNDIKNQLNFHKTQLKKKKRDLAALKNNSEMLFSDDVVTQKNENKRLRQKLNMHLTTNQKRTNDIKEGISTLEYSLKDNTSQLNDLREQIILYQEKMSNYGNQEADIAENIDKLCQNMEADKQVINNLGMEISESALSDDHESQILHINSLIQKLQAQLTQCSEEINHSKMTLDSLEKQITDNSEELLKYQRKLDNQMHKKQYLETKISKLKEQLIDKYKVDIHAIDDIVIDDSLDAIKNNIDRLKNDISALGMVNISAIDEYKVVSERYNFLVQQSDDLKHAGNQLINTMNKIDQTVKQKFKETFDLVAKEFSLVYSEIFVGGKAKLTLTDPMDLLTTGIEIMAQPPGKKYRNMSLLSGGEKALTAIALMFAVLKVKPVPFSILDEAESALDTNNVERYAQYMTKLDKTTQFIVITHRKETMIYADTLYGVTMQEFGVSKVVSASLNKYDSLED
jgi:chromosome segregation protein